MTRRRTAPVVTVNRRTPNPDSPGYYLVVITCPFCGREHTHGGPGDRDPGDRAAHCEAPGSEVGYVIVYPAEWGTP